MKHLHCNKFFDSLLPLLCFSREFYLANLIYQQQGFRRRAERCTGYWTKQPILSGNSSLYIKKNHSNRKFVKRVIIKLVFKFSFTSTTLLSFNMLKFWSQDRHYRFKRLSTYFIMQKANDEEKNTFLRTMILFIEITVPQDIIISNRRNLRA